MSSNLDSRGGYLEEWYDGASETASETSSVSSGTDDRIPHFYGSSSNSGYELHHQQQQQRLPTPRPSGNSSRHPSNWSFAAQYAPLHADLVDASAEQHHQHHHHAHSQPLQQQQHHHHHHAHSQQDDRMDVIADPLDADRPRFDYTTPMPPPEFYCNLGETAYWSDEMSSPSQSFQSSMSYQYDKWENDVGVPSSSSTSYAFYDAETFFEHGRVVDDDMWTA
jgi:hypothetical protein